MGSGIQLSYLERKKGCLWVNMVLEKKLKVIHLYPKAAGRDSELLGLT